MGVEIERKFLVINDDWKHLAVPVQMRQGYLCAELGRVVRIRAEDGKAALTIKGKTAGISRGEWEYEIPYEDAQALLDGLCDQPLIEKNRYRIPIDGLLWEVDEFFGENAGLVVAELELTSEDQAFNKPSWLGEEVSFDHRYANANLFKNPYSRW